jgi:hypothetical protein
MGQSTHCKKTQTVLIYSIFSLPLLTALCRVVSLCLAAFAKYVFPLLPSESSFKRSRAMKNKRRYKVDFSSQSYVLNIQFQGNEEMSLCLVIFVTNIGNKTLVR